MDNLNTILIPIDDQEELYFATPIKRVENQASSGCCGDSVQSQESILPIFSSKHNSLDDIQGGTSTERYHLTKRLYDALQNVAATASNKFATMSDLTESGEDLGPALAALTLYVNNSVTSLTAADVASNLRIDGLVTQVTGALNAISANVGSITSLQGRATALEGDVTTIKSDVTTAKADIVTLKADSTISKGDIVAIKADVSTLKADYIIISDLVTTINSDLLALEQALATINGPGLIFNNGKLTLDLLSTTLVSPTITPAWSFLKNDDTAYTPSTSAAKTVTVDKGVKAGLSATYKYPVPSAGQGLPTSVTGNFGTAIPVAGNNSATLNVNNISTNATYSVTLAKPKSGLIVVANQVTFPTGSDTTSDTVGITFLDRSYLGYSTSAVLTATQINALANSALISSKTRTISGVTATTGQYTYYVYPASYGDLTNIIMDGAAPVLGAFTKLTDVTVTNPGGISVIMRVYKSNGTQAFNNNNLAFS